MKIMSTAQEQEQLMELGYSEEEARIMRVELVSAVLEKRLARPWGDKPMPADWVDGHAMEAGFAEQTSLPRRGPVASGDTGEPPMWAVALGTAIGVALAVLAGAASSSLLQAAQRAGQEEAFPEYSLRRDVPRPRSQAPDVLAVPP